MPSEDFRSAVESQIGPTQVVLGVPGPSGVIEWLILDGTRVPALGNPIAKLPSLMTMDGVSPIPSPASEWIGRVRTGTPGPSASPGPATVTPPASDGPGDAFYPEGSPADEPAPTNPEE